MDNKLTKIYLVRHGESESNVNVDKDAAFHAQWGQTEAPLTKKGEQQAQERANTLAHVHFDAVFSSDLTRAKQTAEIITLEKKLAVQTSALIRERSYGAFIKSFAGKTRDEVRAIMKEELKDLDEQGKMQYKHHPHLESPEESAARLITFLREIAVAYSGKTVLVVNHGSNMRSLLTHLGWAKFDELPSNSVKNTGFVVLESDGVDFFVKETQGIDKVSNDKRTF